MRYQIKKLSFKKIVIPTSEGNMNLAAYICVAYQDTNQEEGEYRWRENFGDWNISCTFFEKCLLPTARNPLLKTPNPRDQFFRKNVAALQDYEILGRTFEQFVLASFWCSLSQLCWDF